MADVPIILVGNKMDEKEVCLLKKNIRIQFNQCIDLEKRGLNRYRKKVKRKMGLCFY
jgi:GTPase SAR1 family protein